MHQGGGGKKGVPKGEFILNFNLDYDAIGSGKEILKHHCCLSQNMSVLQLFTLSVL